MKLLQCTLEDARQLAVFNKQLIEDEKSDNPMSVMELEGRMKDFLTTDYHAYFFCEKEIVLGYALVKYTCTPYYLRQFFIDRPYRKQHIGTKAFEMLLEELHTDCIDLEVLSWNQAGNKFWENCGFVERSRYMRKNIV